MLENNEVLSLKKNAFYKMILNVFNLLVPLFVGPYIAGLLNKDLYGIYNRVYAEFQVFFIIGSFGIYNYGMREISKVKKEGKKIQQVLSSLFVIGLLSNVVVTFFYVIYFSFRGTGIDKYVYLVMILQMISNIFYIEFVNEAAENYAFITKKTIFVRVLYLIAVFVFVKEATDVIIYSIVVSATVLLNNLISFFYLKKSFKFDFTNLQLRKHVAPLVVSLFLVNIELLYNQLDKIMLSPFVNDIAVTEYTLPTTLAGMVATLPLALISVSIPRLSYYIGTGKIADYKNTLQETLRSYMSILIPMAVGMFVLAEEIMWLYTKDVYTYAYPVLGLAALSRVIYGYESIATNLLMYACGYEKKLSIFLLTGGIVNLICNSVLVMIGEYSAFSALFTTVGACLLVTVLCKRYFVKKTKIKCLFVGKDILRYFFVSALFVPVAYVIKSFEWGYWMNIVIIVCLCVCIYGAFLVFSKDPLLEMVFKRTKK